LSRRHRAGHAEVVEALITAGAKPDVPDAAGNTAIDEAVRLRQTRAVAALLQNKAKLDLGKALRESVLKGYPDMVAVLLERAGPPDQAGGFLLHDAALKGHTQVAKILMDKGANPRRTNALGSTPLHDAALAGHRDVANLLLDRGAPIDARDSESDATALYNAASFGRTTVVELLLERGARRDIPNRAGQTPLAAAIANGHAVITSLLK
jgi:ankyrin repeat protein